jgi:hypothetical protein
LLLNTINFKDPTELNPLGTRDFAKDQHLKLLREVNAEVTLPSWIGWLPSKIGSAKGGKLKANEWVGILFVINCNDSNSYPHSF